MASSMLSSLQDFTLRDYIFYGFLVFSTILTFFLATLPSRYNVEGPVLGELGAWTRDKEEVRRKNAEKGRVTVQVVVLGDIGRSPRMQYHALSLAKHGALVQMIGYQESDMHPDMYRNSNIEVIGIPKPPKFLQTDNKSLFLITAPLKVFWQVASLYYILGYGSRASRWMLVQNPPSIPTLAVATFISFFRNTRLVIDWHNYGHSILALKLGNAHPLVKISKQYELFFGGLASAHFCVTNVMGIDLRNKYGIPAKPLHDRPPMHFQPLTNRERVFTLKALEETRSESLSIIDNSTRLVVSATSWTADEDFSILLRALTAYAAQRNQNTKLPRILAIITGKGPQKAQYLDRIRALQNEGKLDGVTIKTAWLSMTDYAALLGAADLGVSLHTSSSGLDLPMKVVDMFGTGLPVLGWSKFPAWKELVFEGINGRGFGNSNELANLLVEVLADGGRKLQVLRAGALRECDVRWDNVWDDKAGRMFGLVK